MASAESSDISSRTVLFATSPEIVEWREQTYKLLHARCAALRALEEQAVDSADEYDQADPKQDVGDSLFNAIGPSFEAAMSIESSPWPRRDIGGLVSEDISIDLAKPAMCTLGFWFQVWQDNRFYAEVVKTFQSLRNAIRKSILDFNARYHHLQQATYQRDSQDHPLVTRLNHIRSCLALIKTTHIQALLKPLNQSAIEPTLLYRLFDLETDDHTLHDALHQFTHRFTIDGDLARESTNLFPILDHLFGDGPDISISNVATIIRSTPISHKVSSFGYTGNVTDKGTKGKATNYLEVLLREFDNQWFFHVKGYMENFIWLSAGEGANELRDGYEREAIIAAIHSEQSALHLRKLDDVAGDIGSDSTENQQGPVRELPPPSELPARPQDRKRKRQAPTTTGLASVSAPQWAWDVPGYLDGEFPFWFVSLCNRIGAKFPVGEIPLRDPTKNDQQQQHVDKGFTPRPTSPTRHNRIWVVTRTKPLLGAPDRCKRHMDFALMANEQVPPSSPSLRPCATRTSPPNVPLPNDQASAPHTQLKTTRPLSSVTTSYYWSNVLVIGEHKSTSSNPHNHANLALYVKNVFAAQPWRPWVHAIFTDNRDPPTFHLWRFDRAGVLRSPSISMNHDPGLFVNVLSSFKFMSLAMLGFDTVSLYMGSPLMLDLDGYIHHAGVTRPVGDHRNHSHCPPGAQALIKVKGSTLRLVNLMERRSGLICRATTCWIAELVQDGDDWSEGSEQTSGAPDTTISSVATEQIEPIIPSLPAVTALCCPVAPVPRELVVKYSWRNKIRTPEFKMYKLAQDSEVVGIADMVDYEEYMDIVQDVRNKLILDKPNSSSQRSYKQDRAEPPASNSSRGGDRKKRQMVLMNSETRDDQHFDCANEPEQLRDKKDENSEDTGVPELAKAEATYDYHREMIPHDRVYCRLVLSIVGIPVSAPPLTPLQRAQGLYGGLIGHASLYLHGKILHRDISSQNILYTAVPICIPPSRSEFVQPRYKAQPNTPPTDVLKNLHGFLIDLDYAVPYPPASTSGAAHRTGTLPFMSIGVLKQEEHAYRHDLESFFYLLLFIACPEPTSRQALMNLFTGLDPAGRASAWKEMSDLANYKMGLVQDTAQFAALVQKQLGIERNSAYGRAVASFRDFLFKVQLADGEETYLVKARPGEGASEAQKKRWVERVPNGGTVEEGIDQVRCIIEALVVELALEMYKGGT